jgi:XTP/dITP diphosphohydrolase
MSHMMKLVLATNNQHKIREIKNIMTGLDVEFLTAADFPEFPDPEEYGATLKENARIKAVEIARVTGLPALADDSGLEVDYLGGQPGVMSSRFAGPGCTFADNNRKLLQLLEGVAQNKRTARFHCVAALAFDEQDVRFFDGTVEGRITEELRGREGFGYDPVFFFPEVGKTFAEISEEEKNRYSHRGRAFRKVAEYLRSQSRH